MRGRRAVDELSRPTTILAERTAVSVTAHSSPALGRRTVSAAQDGKMDTCRPSPPPIAEDPSAITYVAPTPSVRIVRSVTPADVAKFNRRSSLSHNNFGDIGDGSGAGAAGDRPGCRSPAVRRPSIATPAAWPAGGRSRRRRLLPQGDCRGIGRGSRDGTDPLAAGRPP